MVESNPLSSGTTTVASYRCYVLTVALVLVLVRIQNAGGWQSGLITSLPGT